MTKEFTVIDTSTEEGRKKAVMIFLKGVNLREIIDEGGELGELAAQWCADRFSEKAAQINLAGRLLEKMKEEGDWR